MSRDRFELLERFEALFEAPEPSFERFVRRRDRKRRNQRIAAGAVGIAVFVAATWFVTTGGPFDRARTAVVPGGAGTGPTVTGPATTDAPSPVVSNPDAIGFIGLPPEGATPSSRQHGELVVAIETCPYAQEPDAGQIDGWSGRLFVYSDGRLLWNRYEDLPYGANSYSTGWLEQRLAPEGVELMRSELISRWQPGLRGGDLWCPDGSYLVGARRSSTSAEFRSFQVDAEQLGSRVTDPASWLPASAWEDEQIRAYVPSRFSLTLLGGGFDEQGVTEVPVSQALSALPGRAAALAKAMRWTHVPNHSGSVYLYFSESLTLDQAREFAGSLDEGGLEKDTPVCPVCQYENSYWLGYRFTVRVRSVVPERVFHLSFGSELPPFPGDWSPSTG